MRSPSLKDSITALHTSLFGDIAKQPDFDPLEASDRAAKTVKSEQRSCEMQVYKRYQKRRTYVVQNWENREAPVIRERIRSELKEMRVDRKVLMVSYEWNW